MSFYKPYETPQSDPDSERTPEIIEAEMKALEEAMDALVLLTLKSVCANFLFYILLLTQSYSKNLLIEIVVNICLVLLTDCLIRFSGLNHQ